MIGVANALADRHIPEIDKRTDTFAGPIGRRADMVGGFFFQHRDDLKRVAPLWLNYTERVREDPEVSWTVVVCASLRTVMWLYSKQCGRSEHSVGWCCKLSGCSVSVINILYLKDVQRGHI